MHLSDSISVLHLRASIQIPNTKWSESIVFFYFKYDSISLKAVLQTEGTSSRTHSVTTRAWEQLVSAACVRAYTRPYSSVAGVVSEETFKFQPDTPKSIHTRTKAMQPPQDPCIHARTVACRLVNRVKRCALSTRLSHSPGLLQAAALKRSTIEGCKWVIFRCTSNLSLVQNFILFKMIFYFEKLIQNVELKRVRCAPKNHPFAPPTIDC